VQGSSLKGDRDQIFRATTVIAVRRNGRAAMAADGQVSLGQTIVKAQARKVRTLLDGRVVTGFAGASADAFTLLDRFESKLKQHQENLLRAAVELAKEWRTDRYLRRLEAMLIVMDKQTTLLVGGTGDVIEPDEGVIAIGIAPKSGLTTGTTVTAPAHVELGYFRGHAMARGKPKLK